MWRSRRLEKFRSRGWLTGLGRRRGMIEEGGAEALPVNRMRPSSDLDRALSDTSEVAYEHENYHDAWKGRIL